MESLPTEVDILFAISVVICLSDDQPCITSFCQWVNVQNKCIDRSCRFPFVAFENTHTHVLLIYFCASTFSNWFVWWRDVSILQFIYPQLPFVAVNFRIQFRNDRWADRKSANCVQCCGEIIGTIKINGNKILFAFANGSCSENLHECDRIAIKIKENGTHATIFPLAGHEHLSFCESRAICATRRIFRAPIFISQYHRQWQRFTSTMKVKQMNLSPAKNETFGKNRWALSFDARNNDVTKHEAKIYPFRRTEKEKKKKTTWKSRQTDEYFGFFVSCGFLSQQPNITFSSESSSTSYMLS